jgi:hypothetical protein
MPRRPCSARASRQPVLRDRGEVMYSDLRDRPGGGDARAFLAAPGRRGGNRVGLGLRQRRPGRRAGRPTRPKSDRSAGLERAAHLTAGNVAAARVRRMRRCRRDGLAHRRERLAQPGGDVSAQLVDQWHRFCPQRRDRLQGSATSAGSTAARSASRPGPASSRASDLPAYSGLGTYIGLPLTTYGGAQRVRRLCRAAVSDRQAVRDHAALRDHYSMPARRSRRGSRSSGCRRRPALRGAYGEAFRTELARERRGVAGVVRRRVSGRQRARWVRSAGQLRVAPNFVLQGNPTLAPRSRAAPTSARGRDAATTAADRGRSGARD